MTPQQLMAVGLDDSHLLTLNDNHRLHHAIAHDWHQLQLAAQSDGITLAIASGYRSFQRQQSIWNRKAQGELAIRDKNNQVININQLNSEQILNHILHWSALPGSSRHHWGTDIDVYAPCMLEQTLQLEPWEYDSGGPMAELGLWLDSHLSHYGFYRPYDIYRGGVAREPWHISHIEQSHVMASALDITVIRQLLLTRDIALKNTVLNSLDTIYNQFITNVKEL